MTEEEALHQARMSGIPIIGSDLVPVGTAYLVVSNEERPPWESRKAFADRLARSRKAMRVVKLEVPPPSNEEP